MASERRRNKGFNTLYLRLDSNAFSVSCKAEQRMDEAREKVYYAAMQEFMKADVFFFVTTVSVILVTVGIIAALYYIIKILRNVRDVSDRVEAGSEVLSEDLSEFRLKVKSTGFSLRLLQEFFRRASRWLSGAPLRKKNSK